MHRRPSHPPNRSRSPPPPRVAETRPRDARQMLDKLRSAQHFQESVNGPTVALTAETLKRTLRHRSSSLTSMDRYSGVESGVENSEDADEEGSGEYSEEEQEEEEDYDENGDDDGEDDGDDESDVLQDNDYGESEWSDNLSSQSDTTDSNYDSGTAPPRSTVYIDHEERTGTRRRSYMGNAPRPPSHSRSRHSFKKVYSPPLRVEDPSRSLSVTVSLRATNGERWTDPAHPMARPWVEPRSSTTGGPSKTECLTIHAADHYADEAGDSMITLVCSEAAELKSNASVQMRWLHSQQKDPNIRIFEDLILHCPHAEPGLKSVGLALLRDRRQALRLVKNEGESVQREYIIRYDYRDHNGVWNEQSVTFMNVPFFVLKKRSQLLSSQWTPSSAVPIRYFMHRDFGLDDLDLRVNARPALLVGADAGKEICVTYLWCMLLGPNIIVTCGDIPLSDLLGSSVTVDMKSDVTRKPCAIRIVDSESRYFYLVIEPPLSFFEFMKHVSSITRLQYVDDKHSTNFKLLTEELDDVTPERWVDLMQRDDLENLHLQLLREGQYDAESDNSSDEASTVRTRRINQRALKKGRHVIHVLNDIRNVAVSEPPALVSDTEIKNDGGGQTDKSPHVPEALVPAIASSQLGPPSEAKSRLSNRSKSSQRKRGVKFADNVRVFEESFVGSVGSGGAVDGQSTNSTQMTIHPFFTWNVLAHSKSQRSEGQRHIRVYQLLDQVDKAMSKKRPKTHRQLYLRGFECTLQELTSRHPYLTNELRNVAPLHAGSEGPQSTPGENGRIAIGTLTWDSLVINNLRPLFVLSREVAQNFVPADLEVVHRCWKKLWGSLDRILRCIEAHYKVPHVGAVYTISNRISSNASLSGAWESNTTGFILDCSACKEGSIYPDLETALNHLHERHDQCHGCSQPSRILDDPCMVWVDTTPAKKADPKVVTSQRLLFNRLLKFTRHLVDLHRCVTELQLSVQYAGDGTPDQEDDAGSKLPLLPSTLLRSFEEILLSHVSVAHCMSRTGLVNQVWRSAPMNAQPKRKARTQPPRAVQRQHRSSASASSQLRSRGDTSTRTGASSQGASRSAAAAPFEVRKIYDSSMEEAVLRLKQARRDLVLLSTTTSRAGGVNLTTIGTEFLLAVVLSNLYTHVDGKKTDLIQMYNRRLAKIADQTTRSPQRRLFLELYALEDDMKALLDIYMLQQNTWDNFHAILDLNSYKVTTNARRTLFDVEGDFVDKESTRGRVRAGRAQWFISAANYYHDRIKQQIEVLEEGHGKAIRVFTFVTAFFLPLSFVTSFMGMNTTDIRDTDLNQNIFWKVAIPMTALILALAFLYGYKWDDIQEYFAEKWERGQRRLAQRRARRADDDENEHESKWHKFGMKLKRRGERNAQQSEKSSYNATRHNV